MAMLRTLGWFTEILIGSLFAQLCDHALQQFWVHHGGGGLQGQSGLLDGANSAATEMESPWIVGEGKPPVLSAEQELWTQLKSTVSETDALLEEFQRRATHRKGTTGGSFCGCVRRLLSGRGESDEELVARTRAVRRRLSELAGAVNEEASEKEKEGSVVGIAGVVLTYVWWACWIYNKSREMEIPRISLIPSSLLEYLE